MKKDQSVNAGERQIYPKGYFGLTPAALAFMYVRGECVASDLAKARELFQLAINNGNEEARVALETLDRPNRESTSSGYEWRKVEYEYTIYRYESTPPPPAYVPPISPFYGSCHNPMGC